MASRNDFVSNPSRIVDDIFGEAKLGKPSAKDLKGLITDIAQKFRTATAAAAATTTAETATSTPAKPPSLNALKSEEWRDGMLVRFRGMVQDMFESEIFLADFPADSSNTTSNSSRVCGLFRDAVPTQSGLDPLAGGCTLMDRQSLYCVPVPGETFWVKELDGGGKRTEDEAMQTEGCVNTNANSLKRPCDDAMDGEDDQNEDQDSKADSSPKKAKIGEAEEESEDNKASKPHPAPSKPFQLNFPLANEKGPAIIAKIYDPSSDLKVCDVCEFVGILSLDQPAAPSDRPDPDQMEFCEMETETMLQSPPTSLVPRLHVIYADKIHANNPLLPAELRHHVANDVNDNNNGDNKDAPVGAKEREVLIAKELAELKDATAELTTLFTTLLLGDQLAAEYLLCHLISSVHSRRDLRPIGKMTLNLANCPAGMPVGKRLAQVMEWLCPSVDRLPMSLSVLNGPPFVPVKDYESNRVISSRLQLAKGTEVVLDETVLVPGRVDEKGIRNLTILGNLIQWQRLDYDFKWTTQEFPTDLRLVVVSEGKSMLPSDFHVHLEPSGNLDQDQYDNKLNELMTSKTATSWSRLRRFLSLAQISPYVVEDQVQKTIEQDFVAARAESERNLTVEDFERLLLMARYVTLSECASNSGVLSIDTWNRCKRMEEQRKAKIPPVRGGGGEAEAVRVGVEQ